MKTGIFHIHGHRGFSLLEVIAIMIIGATLAALVIPYVSTSVSHSSSPVTNLQNMLTAHQTMEMIIADYATRLDTAYANDTTVDLTALQTAIGSSGDQDNAYGTYTVLENEFIEFDAAGNEQSSTANTVLKVRIADASGVVFTTIFTDR